MSVDIDRFYALLPDIYRQRDAERDYPLRALLKVIAEQVKLVEEDMDQLYENWFIETCENWVVPYIGDLLGWQPVHGIGELDRSPTAVGKRSEKNIFPRREVAKTIYYRRRKGTIALLEELANDIANWPARAVEFYKLVSHTQNVNHLSPESGRSLNLRNSDDLACLDSPFDRLSHTIDVRRINSIKSAGRYNLPNIGLFVWRLKVYPVTKTSAYCHEEIVPGGYSFSRLGNDVPLYTLPKPENDASEIAAELNLPIPIQRRYFEEKYENEEGKIKTQAAKIYYGQDKSLQIWVPGWHNIGANQPVPREKILPVDLNNWHYEPPKGHIAVDPELGRIRFHPRDLPGENIDVKVSYHYGFSGDIGGGEYPRLINNSPKCKIIQVSNLDELKGALEPWGIEAKNPPISADEVIEIMENMVFEGQQLRLKIKENHSLQIRTAKGRRSIFYLPDLRGGQPDSMLIVMEPNSRLILDGLLISGRGVKIKGSKSRNGHQHPREADHFPKLPDSQPRWVDIRHCTLVPGWTLDPDCGPVRPEKPSLELTDSRVKVNITHSILGSIQVSQGEVLFDPISIEISDSILDATGTDCDNPRCEALGAPGQRIAHAVLSIKRCTVIGQIQTHAIQLAENSIFLGKVHVARRQTGCMRFSYVPLGSRTPKRYHCQPDLVRQQVETDTEKIGYSEEDETRKLEHESRCVRPVFNSLRYGKPAYCQLANRCPEEIKTGADDESEMGVFHNLYQPQREANLKTRLEEYVPAGMQVGILFES